MIRKYENSEKVSDNLLKIKYRVKNMYLCFNYEKGKESEIEIEIQLKFPQLQETFLLYEKNSNDVFKINFKDSKNCVIPIEVPICEDIYLNISYQGDEIDSYIDIYPIYYK